MSDKPAKPQDVIKLDTETVLQTTEGRIFINQLNTVSHVLAMRDAEIEFKGEEIVKTGYVGDWKSVQLYKCPNGYFLFCDAAFGKNNWSTIGKSVEEVLDRISDEEVRRRVEEELSAEKAA